MTTRPSIKSEATRYDEQSLLHPPSKNSFIESQKLESLSVSNSDVRGGSSRPLTEQERVEKAGRALAAREGDIRKLVLCYVARTEEWWIVLYADLGHIVDVRKYVWNPESEKLERFLVIDRIPHSRLNDEETPPVKGGTCTSLAVPTRQPGADNRKSP